MQTPTNTGNDVDAGALEVEDAPLALQDDNEVGIEEFEAMLQQQPALADDVVPAPAAAAVAANRHDDTVDAFNHEMWAKCRDEAWGPFVTWIWKPVCDARPFGSIEVTCPFHENNASSGCNTMMSLRARTEAEFETVVWTLRHWCNGVGRFNRQKFHILPH